MGSAELTKNGPFVLLLGWRPSALNRFLLLQNRFHFRIVGFLSYVLWVLSVCWTCWSLRPLQLGFQFVPTIKHINEIEVGVVSHNQNCRLNSVFKSETSFCWPALFIVLPCPKKRQHEDSPFMCLPSLPVFNFNFNFSLDGRLSTSGVNPSKALGGLRYIMTMGSLANTLT